MTEKTLITAPLQNLFSFISGRDFTLCTGAEGNSLHVMSPGYAFGGKKTNKQDKVPEFWDILQLKIWSV